MRTEFGYGYSTSVDRLAFRLGALVALGSDCAACDHRAALTVGLAEGRAVNARAGRAMGRCGLRSSRAHVRLMSVHPQKQTLPGSAETPSASTCHEASRGKRLRMNLGCICLRGPSYLCLVSFGFLVCRDFKGSGSARQRLRLPWLEVVTAKAQAGRFARQKGAEFDGLVDRHLAVLRIGQLIKNGMTSPPTGHLLQRL